ncbi:hypothetical protein WME79_42895 [Sorangium sp. So ce726]
MARMATEDEIAGSAPWLCSDGSACVTGAPLPVPVDGGSLVV